MVDARAAAWVCPGLATPMRINVTSKFCAFGLTCKQKLAGKLYNQKFAYLQLDHILLKLHETFSDKLVCVVV